MDEFPLELLSGILILLIILSALFSSSETAMMALNKYRLRHLAKSGHRSAIKAEKLLDNTDRLIGVILLGNNFVNILASSLATVIAMHLFGEAGIAIATGVLTLVILIFAEVAPKTLAAQHPEKIAFPMSWVISPLLLILYPLVWLVNLLANGLLRLFGIKNTNDSQLQNLSAEELKTLVDETGDNIGETYQSMLSGVLDLDNATIAEIMVPRGDFYAIDIQTPIEELTQQLIQSPYTRLPVFEDKMDNMLGFIHIRDLLPVLTEGLHDADQLRALITEPYFIPEHASLKSQVQNFQDAQVSIGLVVDEYGDILGLLTMNDLLEEIVGDFTTDDLDLAEQSLTPQEDGSYLASASESIRDINKALNCELPTDGPKTLNGLILEHFEMLPKPGTTWTQNHVNIEVKSTSETAIETVILSFTAPTDKLL